jgi:signal transduction histidine kinase
MATRGRPWVWATALAVAVFQVVGSFGAADNQPERKAVDAVAVLLLLTGPAALAVRDRWPVAAAAVPTAAAALYIGLGYPYGPVFVSVVVGLFVAVQAGRRRAAWLVAAGGYVAFLAATAVDPRREDGLNWLHFTLVAGWLALVLAVSEVVRIQREQAADRARAAAVEQEQRAGEQRLELAQELHDVLAHNIALINVQSSVALHLLDEQPGQARPALGAIKDASHQALVELRTALDVLRRGDAAPRSPAPRLAELPALVDAVRAGGLDVRLEQRGDPVAVPAAVELAAYRIVQEALTNVTRHARAKSATVRVAYGHGVAVEVLDDGVGGRAEPGHGIAGMQARAAAVGGHAEAGPRPGGGFRVAARLPVDPP